MYRAMGGTDAGLLLQAITGWDTEEWRAAIARGAAPPTPSTDATWVARRQYVLTHLLDGMGATAARLDDAAAAAASRGTTGTATSAWKILPSAALPEHAPPSASDATRGVADTTLMSAAVRDAIVAHGSRGTVDVAALAEALAVPARAVLTAATATLALYEPVLEMPLHVWGAAAWCCLLATAQAGDRASGGGNDATAKAGRAVAGAVDVVCGLPRGSITSVLTTLGVWHQPVSPAAATQAAMRAALAAAPPASGGTTGPRGAATGTGMVGAAAEAALAAAELALLAQMRRGAYGR
jgi:hypothetical protein